jgi:LysR family nitrogen assimilation transcriptional regulator
MVFIRKWSWTVALTSGKIDRAKSQRSQRKVSKTMELRQLRYFKTLALHQHFGRAAQVLHIAQPALSRQIQLLEAELGVRLVNRHSRGAALTAEGNLLLERATFLVRFMDQIKLDIVALQASLRGPVVIGLPVALARMVVPPLVSRMRDRYPDVNLRVHESFLPALCEALEKGTIDFAVLSGPVVATPLIHLTPLLNDKICAVARCDDSSLPPASISVAALQGVPLILTGVQSAGVRLALDRAADLARVKLNVVVEVETAAVAARLVQDGVGWTVHYAAAVASEIAAGTLRAVPIDGLILQRYLARPVLHVTSQAAVAMIALFQETVSALIHSGQWPLAELAAAPGAGS